MGQPIHVNSTVVVDDVAVFDADRSLSGQDGAGFDSAEEADESFPGILATRLFQADASVNHVFVGSNVVVVRRTGGWDDPALAGAAGTVRDFFVFYDDNRGAGA